MNPRPDWAKSSAPRKEAAGAEKRLADIEGQLAVIDSNRIALTAMHDPRRSWAKLTRSLAANLIGLQEKVTSLYGDVEAELRCEDERWGEAAATKEIDTVESLVAPAPELPRHGCRDRPHRRRPQKVNCPRARRGCFPRCTQEIGECIMSDSLEMRRLDAWIPGGKQLAATTVMDGTTSGSCSFTRWMTSST